MKGDRLINASERWFRLLLRLYPADFRDDMGAGLVETYRDRAREALNRGGVIRLAGVWLSALAETLRSGPGERARPAASWRRAGNWGRDVERAARRLMRSPALAAAMAGTLTVGLGAFAVVFTVVQKILIEPMPYRDPDNLYFVWRDYTAFFDLNRGWLGGPDVAELQKAGGVIEDAVGRAVDARDFKGRGLKLYPVGLKADLVSSVRPALLVLGFAGVFLVLVLMVNLASVLLARAAEREHEFAVSRALGANGAAIVRATLIEGGLMGLLGGVAAALVAIWGTRTLVALAPLDLPRREAIAVDWGIAAVVVGVGVLLGLLAATAPAVWAARASLSSLLAASAVRGGGGHGRMRRGMVVAQMALTLVLLSAAGLVVRSFERLLDADPGFRPEGVLTARVPMPTEIFPEMADVLALQNRLKDALAAIPGVTGVSATSALPLTASASQNTIRIPGAPGNTGDADRDAPLVDYIGARAAYFEVMGMRLLAGRGFDDARRDDVREALIDDLLARQFFPVGSPLGAKIPFGDRSLTIVGVVGQARLYDVHRDGRPQLFMRAEDWGYRTLSFVLRTGGEPQKLVPDLRAAIRRVEPRLALADVRTMDEIVRDALRQQRVSAVLVAGFALGALVLAAMGLFGVISGSVTRRRHELAVRLALGADHRRILRLVLGEGVWLVGMGVLVGAPGIYMVGSLIRASLVGVSPLDPLTLLAVTLGLALVALAACYVPARRVLRIDPAQSLRQA
jgi:putative ABC transport system permease protein